MLSKNDIKYITRLKNKKYRYQERCFVVEGIKTVNEFLNSDFKLKHLYTTESFNLKDDRETIITDADLKKISTFKSPNKVLALFFMPEEVTEITSEFIVALDGVNDPGNLGTIIRLCDWFGITDLICGDNTVDCYNDKVVQATMGSLIRVNLHYTNLENYLKETDLPVFGAFMDGDNVYTSAVKPKGILVMGNEANGISKEIEALVTQRISIPRFGAIQSTESLNVATATSILLSEFKRRTLA